jgi:Kef-type K+ transport system membrane component KefB
MVFAFYIENFTEKRLAQKSYDSVKKIEEPILGVFFLLAGAHLNLLQAISAGTLVLTMVLARGIAKYGGTRIASKYTKAEEKVKKYAGLALLPSAGVAIGLVLDAQNNLSDHIPTLSNLMLSIVIGNMLINELISPFFLCPICIKKIRRNLSIGYAVTIAIISDFFLVN